MNTDKLLNEMASFLKGREDHLGHVARFWHGFVNWLKFELAASFSGRYGDPWVQKSKDAEWEPGYVGMEYRHPRPRESGATKLIDLWVYPQGPTGYYFELKTSFANHNRGKQIRAWEADFYALQDVLRNDNDVLGYASVLFGVGFTEAEWSVIVQDPALVEHIRDLGIISDRFENASVRMAALRANVRKK
jgi:hypothetical protein